MLGNTNLACNCTTLPRTRIQIKPKVQTLWRCRWAGVLSAEVGTLACGSQIPAALSLGIVEALYFLVSLGQGVGAARDLGERAKAAASPAGPGRRPWGRRVLLGQLSKLALGRAARSCHRPLSSASPPWPLLAAPPGWGPEDRPSLRATVAGSERRPRSGWLGTGWRRAERCPPSSPLGPQAPESASVWSPSRTGVGRHRPCP